MRIPEHYRKLDRQHEEVVCTECGVPVVFETDMLIAHESFHEELANASKPVDSFSREGL